MLPGDLNDMAEPFYGRYSQKNCGFVVTLFVEFLMNRKGLPQYKFGLWPIADIYYSILFSFYHSLARMSTERHKIFPAAKCLYLHE